MATQRRNLKWSLRNFMSCFLPLCISQLGDEGLDSRGECCPASTTREPDIGVMKKNKKKKGSQRRCDRSSKDNRSSRVSDIFDPIGECKEVAEDGSKLYRYLEEDYIVFCFDVSSDRDTKALTMTRTPTRISPLIDKKEETIDIDPVDDQFEGSNRSFTFPVLRNERFESPDYMPNMKNPLRGN